MVAPLRPTTSPRKSGTRFKKSEPSSRKRGRALVAVKREDCREPKAYAVTAGKDRNPSTLTEKVMYRKGSLDVENKDYIKADKRDKWVGIALALAALVVLAVSFWERMQ